MSSFVFSSESVTEGHPDKIADQVSDAVLDAVMKDDPEGRVACETFVTTGLCLVGGEITTSTYVDIPALVRGVIKSIGYTDASYGFDYETCAVITTIDRQSPDIAMGVNTHGAGDQGMMFGYATRDTEEMMPLPIVLAHKLTHRLSEVRKSGTLDYLRPDGKSQVSVRYENGVAKAVETIVVSTQHDPNATQKEITEDIKREVIAHAIPKQLMSADCRVFVNPTGRFVIGGPQGDAGLTGRKIIVDTYGGWVAHGGGAFSGKDPTKVDRSAAYAARWVAKNVVAAGLAKECLIQLAYAIGVAEPVSIFVDTKGTSKLSNEELETRIRKTFDLTPWGIIQALELRRPIYRETASYGHFGRTGDGFTWEKTNRVEQLA
ncbi:methionine adenosyltransferase [candidate division KSB1 bacterium]|nr:MAG: methionine adenosyltransferase [candidate division KSB1 bacterium]